jgi:hypothetical protein
MERQIQLIKNITELSLRRRLTSGLLFLFILNNVCALVIVFLTGFGLMVLSEKVILAVLADTVAQAAACFLTITRSCSRTVQS